MCLNFYTFHKTLSNQKQEFTENPKIKKNVVSSNHSKQCLRTRPSDQKYPFSLKIKKGPGRIRSHNSGKFRQFSQI